MDRNGGPLLREVPVSPRRMIGVGLLMEVCYLSFYLFPDGPAEVLLYMAVNVFTFVLLTVLLRQLQRAPILPGRRSKMLLIILGFGILFRLTLVPHEVVGSDDLYRYLWDGKVSASGVNPYAYLPADSRLAPLADRLLPARVSHPEMRTIYPPLAQGLFLVSHVLFGESQAGLKLLLVLLDSLTIGLLLAVLSTRGSSGLPVVLYAWSPLPVLYFALDGHIDALGIPFLVLSLLWFGTRRPARGVLALGMSCLAKLYPLMMLPFLFTYRKGIGRVLLPAIPLLLVTIAYLFFVEPTWGVVESLRTFGSRWEFNGGVFTVLYLAVGANEPAHLVSGLLILACIGMLTVVDRPLLEKTFWAFVCAVLLSPVVHPWYLTWLAALVVLRWSPAVYLLLGLSTLANIVVYRYRAEGVWHDQPLLLILEYVPVFILLGREIVQHRVLVKGEPAGPVI